MCDIFEVRFYAWVASQLSMSFCRCDKDTEARAAWNKDVIEQLNIAASNCLLRMQDVVSVLVRGCLTPRRFARQNADPCVLCCLL